MNKRPLLRMLIRAGLLAVVMIVLVTNRKSLFTPRAVSKATPGKPGANKPLLTGDPLSGERFAWLPQFPEGEKENISTTRTPEMISYGFRFRAPKDPPQVLAFYETHLRATGFTVVIKNEALHAESPDRKRSLDVNVAKLADGSDTNVAAVER